MAGNKTVPLRWGEGGPRIGTATIDENGLVMGEIDDDHIKRLLFGETVSISVYSPNASPGTKYQPDDEFGDIMPDSARAIPTLIMNGH